MKQILKYALIPLFIFLANTSLKATSYIAKQDSTVTLHVAGNCGMCKKRIEKAAFSIKTRFTIATMLIPCTRMLLPRRNDSNNNKITLDRYARNECCKNGIYTTPFFYHNPIFIKDN